MTRDSEEYKQFCTEYEAYHKVDLINRSYIAFIHPDVLEALKEANPEIEKKIVLQPTPWIAKDKCYIMKRIDLEIKL